MALFQQDYWTTGLQCPVLGTIPAYPPFPPQQYIHRDTSLAKGLGVLVPSQTLAPSSLVPEMHRFPFLNPVLG